MIWLYSIPAPLVAFMSEKRVATCHGIRPRGDSTRATYCAQFATLMVGTFSATGSGSPSAITRR